LFVASSSRQRNAASDCKQCDISQHLHGIFPLSIHWKGLTRATPERGSAVKQRRCDHHHATPWKVLAAVSQLLQASGYGGDGDRNRTKAKRSSALGSAKRRARDRGCWGVMFRFSLTTPRKITFDRWLWRRCGNGLIPCLVR
jgi:hypothetical protein